MKGNMRILCFLFNFFYKTKIILKTFIVFLDLQTSETDSVRNKKPVLMYTKEEIKLLFEKILHEENSVASLVNSTVVSFLSSSCSPEPNCNWRCRKDKR
jgi:hypothetical protein